MKMLLEVALIGLSKGTVVWLPSSPTNCMLFTEIDQW